LASSLAEQFLIETSPFAIPFFVTFEAAIAFGCVIGLSADTEVDTDDLYQCSSSGEFTVAAAATAATVAWVDCTIGLSGIQTMASNLHFAARARAKAFTASQLSEEFHRNQTYLSRLNHHELHHLGMQMDDFVLLVLSGFSHSSIRLSP
jgi:hypothetical protein